MSKPRNRDDVLAKLCMIVADLCDDAATERRQHEGPAETESQRLLGIAVDLRECAALARRGFGATK